MDHDAPLSPWEVHDDGDQLSQEYLFVQNFTIPKEAAKRFQEQLQPYLSFLLNDFGLYFYKASYLSNAHPQEEEASSKPLVTYSLHLALFTANWFLENPSTRETLDSPEFQQRFFQNIPVASYSSSLLYEGGKAQRSRRFHAEQMPSGNYQGPVTELGWSFPKLFTHWWLIVPRVQKDFLDLLYQIYTFDIAHQGWIPKVAHFFTIPGNVALSLAFLCQFPFPLLSHFSALLSFLFPFWSLSDAASPTDLAGHLFNSSLPSASSSMPLVFSPLSSSSCTALPPSSSPFEPSLAMFAAGALSLTYIVNSLLKKSPAWGIATGCAIWLLWTIASLWYHAFAQEGAPWYNPTGDLRTNPLVLIYVTSLVEAGSHIIVPQLPPYIVGKNHWHDTLAFFLHGDRLFVFFSFLAGFTFSPLVSYISCPHLIGDMTIYLMLAAGYQKEFYDQYSKVVLKAELSGNPALDDVPIRFGDLLHGMPGTSGVPTPKMTRSEKFSFFEFNPSKRLPKLNTAHLPRVF